MNTEFNETKNFIDSRISVTLELFHQGELSYTVSPGVLLASLQTIILCFIRFETIHTFLIKIKYSILDTLISNSGMQERTPDFIS